MDLENAVERETHTKLCRKFTFSRDLKHNRKVMNWGWK